MLWGEKNKSTKSVLTGGTGGRSPATIPLQSNGKPQWVEEYIGQNISILYQEWDERRCYRLCKYEIEYIVIVILIISFICPSVLPRVHHSYMTCAYHHQIG